MTFTFNIQMQISKEISTPIKIKHTKSPLLRNQKQRHSFIYLVMLIILQGWLS